VQWFRGGLVFKAHRLLYDSSRGLSVIKKKVANVAHIRQSRPDSGFLVLAIVQANVLKTF